MHEIEVRVINLEPENPLPTYQTSGAAGCDAYSRTAQVIQPGETALVPTGLRMEIPDGYEMQIRPRSGLAMKHGIVVFNSPSTIDSDYRGEVGVLLRNASVVPFEVKRGDRIAQFIFAPVTRAVFKQTDVLGVTARGDAGWGSTGKT